MPKRSPTFRAVYAVFFLTLLGLCTLAVVAQSGRRVRKSTPLPPVATPEPTATPNKPAERPKAALTFIVGMDRFGDFSRIPLYVSSNVIRTCANRLDDPDSVKVETETRDISRSDAILRAKSEKEAYIVWLNLVPDNLTGQSSTSNNPYNVYIEYWVFAPTTAKRVTSGRAFPGAYRQGGVIVSPRTAGIAGDYYLNQAAKEVADRILAHFHVGTTNTPLNEGLRLSLFRFGVERVNHLAIFFVNDATLHFQSRS